MKKLLIGVAVALAIGFSGVQVAQARAGGEDANLKKKVFDFDGDNIEGSLLTPEGEFLGGRGKVVHKSLIEYRLHFVPEMLKTADDI
jgi:hypothetical protein